MLLDAKEDGNRLLRLASPSGPSHCSACIQKMAPVPGDWRHPEKALFVVMPDTRMAHVMPRPRLRTLQLH